MRTIVLLLQLIHWLIEPVTAAVLRVRIAVHCAATADVAPFLGWLGRAVFKLTLFCISSTFIGFTPTVCLYAGIVVVRWAVRLLKAVERITQC